MALPLIKFDPNEEPDSFNHSPRRAISFSASVDASPAAHYSGANRSVSQPIFGSPAGRASTAGPYSAGRPTPSSSGGVVAALKKVVQDHSYVDQGPGPLRRPGTGANSVFGPRHAALQPGGHEGVVDIEAVDSVVNNDASGVTDFGFNQQRFVDINVLFYMRVEYFATICRLHCCFVVMLRSYSNRWLCHVFFISIISGYWS
jgi:hypothetical protein